MLFSFTKMHGAGNDFILIDDRKERFPENSANVIKKICRRRTGIGCEGLILIRPSQKADFSMRFFNPDGQEASMCGNGARCIAQLASDTGIAAPDMQFETQAGIISANVSGNSVTLQLPTPHSFLKNNFIKTESGLKITYDFINTGVPHAVVTTDHLDLYPVAEAGFNILKHQNFAPHETNADFIEIINRRTLRIRTYERGVEAETLACGTGITAAAITAAIGQKVQPPVTVHTAGGDTLTVDFTLVADSAESVTLSGPTAYVFKGEIEIQNTPTFRRQHKGNTNV
jgi:diaminopimelate epimerase